MRCCGDAYLLFDKDARWHASLPRPMSWGYTILAAKDALAAQISNLIARETTMKLAMIAIATVAIAAGTSAAGRDGQQKPAAAATVVGTVVDAACFMMHPAAATSGSHEECGTACVARGVPIGIANEADKTLYFPADGGKALAGRLHQRVRVTGSVTEKTDPMELKMPVGDHNEMVVRVEGGYKVITIQTIAAAAAAK